MYSIFQNIPGKELVITKSASWASDLDSKKKNSNGLQHNKVSLNFPKVSVQLSFWAYIDWQRLQ